MLSDDVLVSAIDDGLRSILPSMCRAMDRLFALGFTPNGDIPTLTLASAIFVWRYNEVRDMGVPVEDSLKIAQGSVLSNPNISKYLASKGFVMINNAAGVNNES
jgi:hypothetical protein